MEIRLQKFLADAGIASRRRAELFILEGKVKVNGKIVTELGVKVSAKDKVFFNNKLVNKVEEKIYIMLNKPEGVLSTVRKTREQGKTVVELLNIKDRVFPIGRLDKDSSGLILLTNDGDLALKLSHPRYEKEKEYEVTVDRPVNKDLIQAFSKGVILDKKKTLPARISKISTKSFNVVLKEGRNRQIRRLCQLFGYSVTKLHRIRLNSLSLGNLTIGKWKYLSEQELKKLV